MPEALTKSQPAQFPIKIEVLPVIFLPAQDPISTLFDAVERAVPTQSPRSILHFPVEILNPDE